MADNIKQYTPSPAQSSGGGKGDSGPGPAPPPGAIKINAVPMDGVGSVAQPDGGGPIVGGAAYKGDSSANVKTSNGRSLEDMLGDDLKGVGSAFLHLLTLPVDALKAVMRIHERNGVLGGPGNAIGQNGAPDNSLHIGAGSGFGYTDGDGHWVTNVSFNKDSGQYEIGRITTYQHVRMRDPAGYEFTVMEPVGAVQVGKDGKPMIKGLEGEVLPPTDSQKARY